MPQKEAKSKTKAKAQKLPVTKRPPAKPPPEKSRRRKTLESGASSTKESHASRDATVKPRIDRPVSSHTDAQPAREAAPPGERIGL